MRFYMKYTYIKLIDGMTITYSESATKSGKSVFKKLSKTYKHPRTETMEQSSNTWGAGKELERAKS